MRAMGLPLRVGAVGQFAYGPFTKKPLSPTS